MEIYQEITDTPEKGPLGLLFELNYFGGAFVMFKILKAVYDHNDCRHRAPAMFRWMQLQTLVFYVCCGLGLLMVWCQASMQSNLTRRRAKYGSK